jgi:hypothetical protein
VLFSVRLRQVERTVNSRTAGIAQNPGRNCECDTLGARSAGKMRGYGDNTSIRKTSREVCDLGSRKCPSHLSSRPTPCHQSDQNSWYANTQTHTKRYPIARAEARKDSTLASAGRRGRSRDSRIGSRGSGYSSLLSSCHPNRSRRFRRARASRYPRNE